MPSLWYGKTLKDYANFKTVDLAKTYVNIALPPTPSSIQHSFIPFPHEGFYINNLELIDYLDEDADDSPSAHRKA